ncbi:MAG: flagellar basal body rod protein FlgC [Sedimentisphaerales bacterium]|nr:flagellar basal body rod protein FlgC [Sedimentisphaerales bacterium]
MKIDSFSAIDIATSGMRAHQKNMEIISSNVANARTNDAGNGQPYRRLEPSFKTQSNDPVTGVELQKIIRDMSNFQSILDPGHPQADESGYVSLPNVQLPVEMMNLTVAARAYQANVAVMKRYQNMVESTLELLR